jgi:hypothetical protein
MGKRAYGLVLAGVLDRAEVGERVGPVLDVVCGQLDEHPLQRGRGQVDVAEDLEDHVTVGALLWGVDGLRDAWWVHRAWRLSQKELMYVRAPRFGWS